MLHALGFEQCVPAYLDHTDAIPEDVEAHRAYLRGVLDDPAVSIELFSNTHYLARPTP